MEVLGNEGRLLEVVPASAFLWSDFGRFSGHYRRYTSSELREKVEFAGFEITRLSYFNTLLFPFVWECAGSRISQGGGRPFAQIWRCPSPASTVYLLGYSRWRAD